MIVDWNTTNSHTTNFQDHQMSSTPEYSYVTGSVPPRPKLFKRSEKWDNAILFYERNQPYFEFTNFHRCNVSIDGCVWPSTEHYFQAQKFIGTPFCEQIRNLTSPREAFAQSRVPVVSQWKRSDWEEVKKDIMYRALLEKFSQNTRLRMLLVHTGERELVENSPHDSYWGVGSNGRGTNHLGKLLMKVRRHMFELVAVTEQPPLSISDYCGNMPTHSESLATSVAGSQPDTEHSDLQQTAVGEKEIYRNSDVVSTLGISETPEHTKIGAALTSESESRDCQNIPDPSARSGSYPSSDRSNCAEPIEAVLTEGRGTNGGIEDSNHNTCQAPDQDQFRDACSDRSTSPKQEEENSMECETTNASVGIGTDHGGPGIAPNQDLLSDPLSGRNTSTKQTEDNWMECESSTDNVGTGTDNVGTGTDNVETGSGSAGTDTDNGTLPTDQNLAGTSGCERDSSVADTYCPMEEM